MGSEVHTIFKNVTLHYVSNAKTKFVFFILKNHLYSTRTLDIVFCFSNIYLMFFNYLHFMSNICFKLIYKQIITILTQSCTKKCMFIKRFIIHSSSAMNPSILTLVWISILVSLVQSVFADDVIMQKRVIKF